jgi:hypothetical protein
MLFHYMICDKVLNLNAFQSNKMIVYFVYQNKLIFPDDTNRCTQKVKLMIKHPIVIKMQFLLCNLTTLNHVWSIQLQNKSETISMDRNMRSKCQCSCVLQFTCQHAVCCVLHRPTNQVIPRLGLN